MNYFSLETINNRQQNFKYDEHDKGSEKLTVSSHELENCKLKMSAKQMVAFCQYFTILFGDLIPYGDQIWGYVTHFLELLDDIMCYEASISIVNEIRSKIQKLNSNFQLLFKKPLTPKFHILTHYPLVLQQSGPLRHLWSFKYEGKHKEFKIYAHVITSRKNIAKTFSYKQQMSFANVLLEGNSSEEFSFKKQIKNLSTINKVSKKRKIPLEGFSLYLEAEKWAINMIAANS